MAFKAVECACIDSTGRGRGEESLAQLKGLRELCPALKLVLVPDAIWSEFKKVAAEQRSDSPFDSVIVLAFERCYLSRLTSPIHRYLLADGELRDGIRPGYVKELGEVWHLRANPFEQNTKGRGYLGKITELQFAEWIERTGSEVVGLEAWTPDGIRAPDILIRSPYGVECSYEVKYLGRENTDFAAQYEAFLGFSGGQWFSLESRANYLLSRVYEAARQLEDASAPGRRVACLVLSREAWGRLDDVALQDSWIDWSAPRFHDCDESTGWPRHLEEKLKPDYPEIENDLGEVLRTIQHVWLMNSDHRFNLAMQRVVNLPGT